MLSGRRFLHIPCIKADAKRVSPPAYLPAARLTSIGVIIIVITIYVKIFPVEIVIRVDGV